MMKRFTIAVSMSPTLICRGAPTGWPITSGLTRISAAASSGSSTISAAWSALAGSLACGSSVSTTGIAWGSKSCCNSSPKHRGSGRAARR